MVRADLILLNGNILTMDRGRPRAQAVAVSNGRILKVGSNDEVGALAGEGTRIIDLGGRAVLPGLIDTHVHVLEFGRSLGWVDLRGVDSIEALKERLEERAREVPEGSWILGRGWDQERFVEGRYPTRWDLDEAAPKNPTLLFRVCGHVCVVNSLALKLAGITPHTTPPGGGAIELDPETGEPNGILREGAVDLVLRVVPEPDEQTLLKACEDACRRAVREGLTGLHWIVQSPAEIRAIQRLRRLGRLPLRVYVLVPAKYMDRLAELGLSTGFGDEWVRLGAIKVFVDGSLGARTAALREPYADDPSNRGVMRHSQEELDSIVLKAHKLGFQLAIHAIGDRAVEAALNSIEKALKECPAADHRHRIEHASVLDEHLIARMRSLRVVASVQPHFVVSDFWVPSRLGPQRARWTYPFKTLLRSGVVVAGGSDCPVEPISPLLGIYAAVARERVPEEGVTIEEAIRMYTVNAAYASFEEGLKGSISEGKLADFVVLSQDITKLPPERIRDVEVEMTIVGGRVVYAKAELPQLRRHGDPK